MFKHIYLNNIKIFVREKNVIFWLLLYPMILSIFFKAAFSGLMEGEQFEKMPISVVLSEESHMNMVYKGIFEEMGDTFEVRYTDIEDAKKLLEEEKLDACIYMNEKETLSLLVKENTINQSIIAEITGKINEGVELVLSGKADVSELESIFKVENVVKNIEISGEKQDFRVTWFYTVLGMAAMFGMMLGVQVIKRIQANQSPEATRINLAPVSKMKEFVAVFFSAATLESIIMILVYLYIRYIMGIDFGDRQGLIILTSVVGGITGLSLGALMSVIVKKGEEFKIGICVSVSMLCSFLAGMMDNTMKYTVMQKAPVIEYINPAGIITDSYLKLYYYEDLSYFYANIANLLVITAICMSVTVFILRRQKYDSI